jgi:hypothetical protein
MAMRDAFGLGCTSSSLLGVPLRKWLKLTLLAVLLGYCRDAHAMAYVDPSSAGTLMRVLAPVFILLSALGLQFKHSLGALLRRALRRVKPGEGSKP